MATLAPPLESVEESPELEVVFLAENPIDRVPEKSEHPVAWSGQDSEHRQIPEKIMSVNRFFDAAMTAAQTLPDSQQRFNAFGAIAVALAEAGAIEEAVRVADLITDENIVATQQFHEDPDSGVTNLIVDSDATDAWCAIAKAHAEKGNLVAIENIVARLLQSYQKADLLRDVARIQMRRSDFAGVKATIKILKSRKDIFSRDLPSALCSVACGLAQGGHLSEAETVVKSIRSPHRKSTALYNVAITQARAGDLPGAEGTLARIETAMVRTRTCRLLMETYAKAGQIEKAKAIADSLPNKLDRDDVLGRLVAAQAEAGDISGAAETVKGVSDAAAQLHARTNMHKALVLRGELVEAQAILAEATATATALKKTGERWSSALAALAQAYASVGDEATAIRTYESAIRAHEESAPAWFGKIAELQAVHDTEKAIATAKKIDASEDEASALLPVIRPLVKRKDMKGVKAVVQLLPGYDRAGFLVKVTGVLLEEGEIEKATAMANEIEDATFGGNEAFAMIAQAKVEPSGQEAAEAWIETLKAPSHQVFCYLALAKTQRIL